MSNFKTMYHDGKPIYRIAFVGGQAMYVARDAERVGSADIKCGEVLFSRDSYNIITGATVSINYNHVMFVEDHFAPEERAQIEQAVAGSGFKAEYDPRIIIPGKRGGSR